VDEMPIDEDERGPGLIRLHDMIIPDFVIKSARVGAFISDGHNLTMLGGISLQDCSTIVVKVKYDSPYR